MSLPTVAIVGRPNVGKSSLFNRIIRKRLAVVDPISGVTRDRHYVTCDWSGREFRLVDTGGMVPNTKDKIEKAIYDQASFAIAEADVVLLVVDVQSGVDQADQQLARWLLKEGKTTILTANKADNDALEQDRFDFMKLGLGEPFATSATGGRGVAELLDEVVARLPEVEEAAADADEIRVALVGRPNVGKSSFINKLLGEDRLIVSDIAGTTRDAIDTPFEYKDRRFVLVDTAGLRRKFKVKESLEFYTNLRTTRAIESSQVAVVMLDATDGVTTQDQKILSEVLESRRAAVIVVNKWDLIEKDELTAQKYTEAINDIIARHKHIPIMYISALTGQRVQKVLDQVLTVYEQYMKRIPTSELNDFLQRAFARKKPPARHRKYIQFKYVTQSEVAPPTFVFFVNHPELVDKTYMAYLNNQLRESFGFEGVPIRLKCRRK